MLGERKQFCFLAGPASFHVSGEIIIIIISFFSFFFFFLSFNVMDNIKRLSNDGLRILIFYAKLKIKSYSFKYK